MATASTTKRAISGTPRWLTALFVGGWTAAGLGFMLMGPPTRADMWIGLVFVAAIIGAFLLVSSGMPTVQMDDRFLYVSRHRKSAVVPLKQVAVVRETLGSWPSPLYSATIDFSVVTPFGRSLYLGLTGGIPGFTSPSAVRALRQAVDARSRDKAI